MPKVLSHQMDIYGVHLHLATDLRGWRKIAKELDVDLPSPSSVGLTSRVHFPNGDLHFAFYLNAELLAGDHPALVETAAHESAHAAAMLLDTIGQGYDGTTEALTYLVGWLSAWIWRAVADD